MQRWYPYADSMRVAQLKNGPQLKMYHNDALLDGHAVLKPEGAYASGAVTIKEGTLESLRFSLNFYVCKFLKTVVYYKSSINFLG